MLQHYQPNCMPESEAPFTQVVIDDHYAHLAGIVAADFQQDKALGDVAAETGAILTLITDILSELDLDLSRLVRTDVHFGP